MKKILMFALCVAGLVSASTVFADPWHVAAGPVLGLSTDTNSVSEFGLSGGEIAAGYDLNSWLGLSAGLIAGTGPNFSQENINLSSQNIIAPELLAQFHHEWGWFQLRLGAGGIYQLPDNGTSVSKGNTEVLVGQPGNQSLVPDTYTISTPITSGGFAPEAEIELSVGPFGGVSVGIKTKLTNLTWTLDGNKGVVTLAGYPSSPAYGSKEVINESILLEPYISYTF